MIVDGLADPLEPVVAFALSSTCKGLRLPLQAALEVLAWRHERAKALYRKFNMTSRMATSCYLLRYVSTLTCSEMQLNNEDLATLGMILPFLPTLKTLDLEFNVFDDSGMRALCEHLGANDLPSLRNLYVHCSRIGPGGAGALAAAFSRGAMANVKLLQLSNNPMRKEGIVALAGPLRKLPALKRLYLWDCEMGDEGVAALFANLGKDDFKALEGLDLEELATSRSQTMTDQGFAKMASALNGNAMPKLKWLCLAKNGTAVAEARRAGIAIGPGMDPGDDASDSDEV